MSNQDHLAKLGSKPFQYLPAEGEIRTFSIMKIEKMNSDSVTAQVHDLDNYKKGVFKTLKFERILAKEFKG